jgi:glycosyltransferase involved in cell wall biosynthesis
MPPNSYHHSSQISKNIFGYRHLIFYVYLIYSSFSWSGKSVIRVFGVTIPILKYLKYICKKNLIISYQYDWAEQTRANYKNIKHFLSRTIEKSALYSADYIFCTMPWLDEKLNKYYKIPSYKHEVIPNFVNLKYFYPEKKENIIIYAGRLHWSKAWEF